MTARNFARPAVEYEPAAIPPPIQGVPPGGPGQTAPTDFDPGQWSAELLDPNSWGEILSRFGHTMKLAVALTDRQGNLLGSCHNPQPVWSLTRKGTFPFSGAEAGGACPFCLVPNSPCSSVADALRTGAVVYVHEEAGLAHVAVPLILGEQGLGALIAGQTFDQYPEPLLLQRVARYFGVSQSELWEAAVHQVPVSRATLGLYAELLASLGQAFLRERCAAILDRKLHETNERYRLMIEGLTDRALFTVDAKGYITSWNHGAERLLGYAESEILGKDFAAFFTPDEIRSGAPWRELRLAEESGWIEQEGWRVRKDGTRFLSETITARLGAGDAVEFGKLMHDVTEERKAAEEVLEAQKLESIGVLAGGIAHDFNNLLTSILGNVSLALDGLKPDDPARALLDVAERSSRKAAALITQLLAYAGKGTFEITRFDLSALITEILPLIATSIPKPVQLDLSLPADLPWIRADASEIQQVVMNMVINGAESIGPGGGSLHVSTGAEDPNFVYFEVRDSGCGMDEATQRRIFDPFFTTKFTGRGLGLAAVSGIVRRLDGRLSVESAPGKGSRFRVTLPGVPAQPRQATPSGAGEQRHGAGLILVIDDDHMIRDLARAVLERFGYSVLTAENGQEGVEVFRSNANRIAAVLLDLTMPVMGGGEALRLMNQLRPEVPIVMSSGYGESAIREQFNGVLAGAIRKPYTVTDLREKIAAVLALKKSATA